MDTGSHRHLFESEKFTAEWTKEALDALEPLLAKNTRRFVLFPVKHLAIWRSYKHAVSTFWIADSINASKDVTSWEQSCSSADKKVVGTLLMLLESTNRIHEDLFSAISTIITVPEARCFLGFQAMIENIHREALASLASILVPYYTVENECPVILESITSLKRKLEWTKKQSNDKTSLFSEKLLLFLFVQGIFSTSMTAIFKWIGNKDILPCLVHTHDKITVDRETHINFASLLFYHLRRRPPPRFVENLATEMVEIERSFAEELIRNIDADIPIYNILREIECVADGLLASIGYKTVYGTSEASEGADRKVTGTLKALYFEQEMANAYASTVPGQGSYEELSFDIAE